ncbi:S41 family peptidase [Anaerosoma tenue]|uniref:S41 family peptidase n=1 Tax=Anaerosoma tenue TaxID=2933588 RepID=UPI0022609D2C|nr:S41 family peptidase [Anaerosoma tenue]MCK8114551.1 S41 family peptidase [Anaerosoma tenue]
MEKVLKVTAAVTVVAILLVAAFAGGVFFDRTLADAIDGDRRGSLTDTEVDDAVAEVADIIESLALEPSSEESMTIGAISGMLESLEDSHAVYFTAEQYEYFNEQNMGTFYGIGITISNDGDDLVVNSVIEGTPAARAGLQPGDLIVEIDGEARSRWDVDEAVLRIRGEEGTTVVLGIRRDGAEELIDYTIERAKIDVPNVESEMLEGDIGYVSLVSFTQVAATDVRSAIQELEADGARGFVLDLRNNPGGLLSASVDVSSLFITDGVIVTVEDRTRQVEKHRASGETVTDAPLVVLVNGNSASASEIVAGALQDYGRATLVGEQTFGKGSVQQIEELSFGGAVKLTIAHYLTPDGRAIDKIGLTPDIVVEMEHGLITDRETDVQLQKALEILRGEL